MSVTDYEGRALLIGSHVRGHYNGVGYTAVVAEIGREQPGSLYRDVTVILDEGGAAHETFSDSLVVIP